MKVDKMALRGALLGGVLAVAMLAVAMPADHALAAGNTIATPDYNLGSGSFNSLKLDASGDPVVSYFQTSNLNPDGDLVILRCGNPACSSGNTLQYQSDPAQSTGLYSSLVLDASDNAVVSYFRAPSDDLRVLHCSNVSCSTGQIVTPDSTGSVGRATSIALAAGNPVVSYLGSGLKILHCGDANCSLGNSITTPDATGGGSTSLALDGSGNPVVSYQGGASDLKILHCGDANCSVGNSITSPDTAGDLASTSSLKLDALGRPVVSYYDATNGDLKMLHCDDVNCAGDESANIAAPDTAGDVGADSSLTLDSTGKPAISYHDVTGDNLRLLRCGDPACTSSNGFVAPDPGANDGRWTSLALDGTNDPVVAYYSGGLTNGLEKILHCGSATCKLAAVGGVAELPSVHEAASATRDARGDLPLAPWAISAGTTAVVIAAGGAAWHARRRRRS